MNKKIIITVAILVVGVAGFFIFRGKKPEGPVSTNCPTTATGLCGDELIVFDWGGSDDPNLIPGYTAKYPKPPRWSSFLDTNEALQKAKSGFQVDIPHITNSDMPFWIEAELLRPWDVKKITHWNDMYSFWKKAPGVEPVDGKIYGIPTYFGMTGFVYDRTKIKDGEIKSLMDLTDPKFKGRLTIADAAYEAYALCFIATGKKIKFVDAKQKDIDDCKPYLQALHKNIRFYFADSANVVAAFKTGELWAGFVWQDVALSVNKDREASGKTNPADLVYLDRNLGFALWAQVLTIMNTSKAEVEPLAYEFANAITDKGGAEFLVNEWSYASSNRKAMETMDPKLLKDRSLDDLEGYYKRGKALMFGSIGTELSAYAIKEFEKIKTGN